MPPNPTWYYCLPDDSSPRLSVKERVDARCSYPLIVGSTPWPDRSLDLIPEPDSMTFHGVTIEYWPSLDPPAPQKESK